MSDNKHTNEIAHSLSLDGMNDDATDGASDNGNHIEEGIISSPTLDEESNGTVDSNDSDPAFSSFLGMLARSTTSIVSGVTTGATSSLKSLIGGGQTICDGAGTPSFVATGGGSPTEASTASRGNDEALDMSIDDLIPELSRIKGGRSNPREVADIMMKTALPEKPAAAAAGRADAGVGEARYMTVGDLKKVLGADQTRQINLREYRELGEIMMKTAAPEKPAAAASIRADAGVYLTTAGPTSDQHYNGDQLKSPFEESQNQGHQFGASVEANISGSTFAESSPHDHSELKSSLPFVNVSGSPFGESSPSLVGGPNPQNNMSESLLASYQNLPGPPTKTKRMGSISGHSAKERKTRRVVTEGLDFEGGILASKMPKGREFRLADVMDELCSNQKGQTRKTMEAPPKERELRLGDLVKELSTNQNGQMDLGDLTDALTEGRVLKGTVPLARPSPDLQRNQNQGQLKTPFPYNLDDAARNDSHSNSDASTAIDEAGQFSFVYDADSLVPYQYDAAAGNHLNSPFVSPLFAEDTVIQNTLPSGIHGLTHNDATSLSPGDVRGSIADSTADVNRMWGVVEQSNIPDDAPPTQSAIENDVRGKSVTRMIRGEFPEHIRDHGGPDPFAPAAAFEDANLAGKVRAQAASEADMVRQVTSAQPNELSSTVPFNYSIFEDPKVQKQPSQGDEESISYPRPDGVETGAEPLAETRTPADIQHRIILDHRGTPRMNPMSNIRTLWSTRYRARGQPQTNNAGDDAASSDAASSEVDHDSGASEPTGDIDIETELSRLGIPMVEAELVVSLEDPAVVGEGEEYDDNVYRAERVPTVRLCGKEVTRSGAALSAGIAALLVALAASVPLTLVTRNNRNNGDVVVRGGDVERPEEAARRSRVTDAIAVFAKADVTDPESPHGHALEWMLGPENADLDFSIPGAEQDSMTKQRFAMALFYYTAGGDNWLAKEEFLSEEHICDWSTMIVCANETNDREVAELQFGDNNLQGTIPRELLYLETLKTLNLTGNMGLAGSLPSDIGEIASLEILDLRDAKFVGPIPDSFANLRNLRHLDLRNNFLAGGSEYKLPGSSVIGSLRELRHLDLSGNLFTHVEINALLRLTRLEYLDISHNKIGNAGNHGLEFGFSAVPSSIGALAQLRVFNVAHNNFGGTIHPNIAKCKRLEELRLNDNGYSGGMPSELGQLKALRVLDLSNNVGLGGSIPSALENLKTLKHLNLKNSGITGSLPKQFGRGMEMETLILDANFLTGSIPRDIFNMRQLRELRLASNYLEGSIPAEVGNATGLLQFTLFENYLEGPLPSEIGNLVNLTSIVFGWNGFNSSLPETLGNLVNLEILILDDNFFTGTLPTTLGNLKNLMEIHVPNNALNGTLPSELGRLTALKDVGLQSNVFTGTIPRELGNLGNIWYLSMGDNSFSGTLPGWIGTSKLAQSLTHFELPRTNLEGTLPAEWGMLSSLQKLKMHGNHLITGTIPIEWANMTKLDGMWIFNTSLTGSVNHLCREEFVDFGSQNCDDCGLEVDLEDVECECCHCCIDNDYVEWEDDLYGAEDGNEEGGLDEDNITIGST